jgi:MATE family multidrug resistance protein
MRPILTSGWLMGLAFALLSVTAFSLFNREIASLFIKDPNVLRMAASLLVVAGFFQFSDTMQIIAAGALRGLDDVKVPAWLALGAYWAVSIPLGWVLAYPLKLGVTGMWWGITLGLTITAVLLGRRIWRKTAPGSVGL